MAAQIENTVLLSTSRSGTNLFLDVYQQIFPEHIVLHEIFRVTGDSMKLLETWLNLPCHEIDQLRTKNPPLLLKLLDSRSAISRTPYIFKIFYRHSSPDSELWNHIKVGRRIVWLIRRNLFDIFVSWVIANKTNIWHLRNKNSPTPLPTITIDPRQAEEFIRQIMDNIELFSKSLRDVPYHITYYEELSESPENCVSAIENIFALPHVSRNITPIHRKQKYLRNVDLVANYKEVEHLDRDYLGEIRRVVRT